MTAIVATSPKVYDIDAVARRSGLLALWSQYQIWPPSSANALTAKLATERGWTGWRC